MFHTLFVSSIDIFLGCRPTFRTNPIPAKKTDKGCQSITYKRKGYSCIRKNSCRHTDIDKCLNPYQCANTPADDAPSGVFCP